MTNTRSLHSNNMEVMAEAVEVDMVMEVVVVGEEEEEEDVVVILFSIALD